MCKIEVHVYLWCDPTLELFVTYQLMSTNAATETRTPVTATDCVAAAIGALDLPVNAVWHSSYRAVLQSYQMLNRIIRLHFHTSWPVVSFKIELHFAFSTQILTKLDPLMHLPLVRSNMYL